MSFQKVLALVVLVATVAHCNHYGHHYKHHSIELPKHSNHHVSHYKEHSTGYAHTTNVEVGPGVAPIKLHMLTASSPLKVSQSHYGAGGSHHESYSQDKPHYLTHTVHKPVYQEVKEIVTPHRKITQYVKPVHENIKTHVAENGGHHYGHEHKGYGHGHGYEHKEHHYDHGHGHY